MGADTVPCDFHTVEEI